MITGKKEPFTKLIAFLLLLSFTGCVTAKIEYVKEKDFPPERSYMISAVYLKDGKIIDLKGKEPKFKMNIKNEPNVILYMNEGKQDTIKLNDIDRLKIEIYENNALLTSAVIAGTVLAVILFILIFTDPFEGMRIG
jgi:hypothetical protein